MKVLYPDNHASTFSGTNVDADYPASNLDDEHPKYVCKATGNNLIVTCSAAEMSNGVVAFNSNATTATVTIQVSLSLSNRPSLELRSPLALRSVGEGEGKVQVKVYDLSGSAEGALWAEYTTMESTHVIELRFTSPPGTICQVGVVRVGKIKEYEEPFYGIQEGLHSFDAVDLYNGGEVHIDDGDNVRTFAFTILEDLDPDWWEFMFDVAQSRGMRPMAYKLLTS
jgi:hypothetical protein